MHTVKINSQTFTYPSLWDELNKKQLLFIVNLFINGHNQTQLKLRTVLHFLNLDIGRKPPRNIKGEKHHLFRTRFLKAFMLSDQQLISLVDSLDFLTVKNEEGNLIESLDSKLTVNLLPHFKLKRVNYYGPAVKLLNLVFKEFIVAESFFLRFLKSQDTTDLDHLAAVLYRKESMQYDPNHLSFKGDRREPFNDFLIESRADAFANIPLHNKIVIALYYQGCRKHLHRSFPNVFSTDSRSTENKSPDRGFLDLVDALTNNDVTKTDQIYDASLYNIMIHLENAAKNKIKMEAKLKSRK